MAAPEVSLGTAPGREPLTPRASVALRDPNLPRSFYSVGDGRTVRQDMPLRDLVEAARSGEGTLWVDVDVTNRHQFAVLEKVFNFHPLALEDSLNPNTRVKLEEYPEYLFIVVRGVRFCEETDNPYDTETFNLGFFIGTNFLVTVHGEHAPAVTGLGERLVRNPEVLARGAQRLMYLIMDASVDAFFPILDQIDEFVDGLEERVFGDFDQDSLRDIFAVKRLVLSLRRHLAPQREVFNVLTNRPSHLVAPDTQVYFRDIYDHVLRINDSLETYRELLSSTLDSYLTQVSNRLGQTTKGLSIVATMSIPFVVVSGMWGMNFARVPLSGHPHGFLIMLVLQLAMGGALIALLRWRRLL